MTACSTQRTSIPLTVLPKTVRERLSANSDLPTNVASRDSPAQLSGAFTGDFVTSSQWPTSLSEYGAEEVRYGLRISVCGKPTFSEFWVVVLDLSQ